MRLIVALRAACAVLASAGCVHPASMPAASGSAEPDVTVAREHGSVTATARYPGGCVASLSHSPASLALRYRNECEPALAANLRALAALKIALFGTAGPPERVMQLDAGRLVMTWPELALRLALAARASPDWDAARAARNDGYANAFVRDLANRRRLFHELDDLLGRDVTLASVEKVLIGAPALTPIAAPLRAHGVGERERLPFDAQVRLELQPAAR